MKKTITTLVLTAFLMLSIMSLVPVSENVAGTEATVNSILVHMMPTDETGTNNFNEHTQTSFKAQLVFSTVANYEGQAVNFTLKHRNTTTPWSWSVITYKEILTDENGTAYWNFIPQNFTYPACTGTGSQYWSLNVSSSLKYNNQSFILNTADNVTVLIDAPEYVSMGSVFRPFIQAFSHENRYEPYSANVSIDVIHWSYTGTNTTVKSINTAFNADGWVQPTIYLNDTDYNEGYYELFVGLHNHTATAYPNADYLDKPATGTWYYHRAWHGFRISNEIIANAGTDQEVNIGTNTTLTGSSSTGDLLNSSKVLNYTWTRTAGTSVTLTNPYTATPYFTAPTTPDLLVFRLNITDDRGRYTYDYVTVRVYDSKITLGAGWNMESNPTGAAVAMSVIAGKSTYITTCTWRDDSTSIWYSYVKTAGVTDKNVPAQGGVFIYNSGSSALTVTL